MSYRKFNSVWKKLACTGLAIGGGAVIWTYVSPHRNKQLVAAINDSDEQKFRWAPLPTREQHFESIQKTEFDVLVIGGGATGFGVALDAVSRGLKTAMVEMYDFGSGTSSRSTKLIHGGVRYLQKAVFNLDIEQYRMVKEALAERANLIEIAPHLAYSFPIMLPVYKYWQVPYYWAGIKAYDFVAGKQRLKPSYLLSKKKALEIFPMLKKEKLVGALVYYDGQHDDARMNISLAVSTARRGGVTLNYTQVIQLHREKDADGKDVITGARIKDRLTGKEMDVKAKCVINATGPYTDSIRTMGSPETKKICQPSSGVHVVLPDYYSPKSMGLLDPATSDGRVIFFLPWQNVTLAGTTDNACDVTFQPAPTENEIQFILNEVRNYLHPDVEVRRGDVLSAWCGIRPLVSDPNKSDTQSLARNHIIEVSQDKLITIAAHSPDNSFMGFVVERHLNESDVRDIERSNMAVVYGKNDYMWQDKKEYLNMVNKSGIVIHGTVYKENKSAKLEHIPNYVINHGILNGEDLHTLLRKSKIFLGLGFPYEGPAPLEAIANGAVYINPKFAKPHNRNTVPFFKGKPTERELTSQHPYVEQFIGEPYVYTININDPEEVRTTIQKILDTDHFKGYLPYEYTEEGFIQRMNAYIEHQNFCQFQKQLTKWPPESAVQILFGEAGKSCKDVCWEKNLICEPSHFLETNSHGALISHGASCAANKTLIDIFYPALDTKTNDCILQQEELLFSCVGKQVNLRRLCPCRNYIKGQTALCLTCES